MRWKEILFMPKAPSEKAALLTQKKLVFWLDKGRQYGIFSCNLE